MANKKNQSAKPEATVSEGQDNAVSAKLRVLEARMSKLLKKLETMFGIDIDGDGKSGGSPVLAMLFLCLFSAVAAFAVPQSTNTIWNLVDSTGTNDLIQVLKDGTLKVDGSVVAASTTLTGSSSPSATIGALAVQTNATVGGTLVVTGASTLTGGIVGGVSRTNTFYTVAAGTDGCLTNVIVTRSGIVITGTTGQ